MTLRRDNIVTLLALLVIAIALPFAIVDTIETARVYVFSRQFLQELPQRFTGPGRMHFILQPMLAIALRIRGGLADAKGQNPPYLLALILGAGRRIARQLVLVCIALCSGHVAMAQTLAPRAYVITPVHGNAITLSWSFYNGGLNFNGAIPITGATGIYHVPVLSYYHSFSLFGRSANFTGFLPYAVGTFGGSVLGTQTQIYRSGLLDVALRFSVNLKGGPAMSAPEFARWKQKALLGASLTVIAPTGQYNPTHLINWGINRWAFRPELGYSQRWRKWVLDGYGGVWFYTTNSAFYALPTPRRQTERPIGSFEGHLSYDFGKLRCWVSLDGNFWFGGTTSLNGISNPGSRQTSSRIGATASFPLVKHQSIKISYSTGTYVRFGGNYQSVSMAWQYSWIGWPKFHSQQLSPSHGGKLRLLRR